MTDRPHRLRRSVAACILGMALAASGLASTGRAETALSTGSGAAAASEPRAQTFRRVKVEPVAPGGRRITVQIDAEEQARILAANPAVPARPEVPFDRRPIEAARPGPGAAPQSGLAWYWEHISPSRAEAGPGRLAAAVAALRRGPAEVPAPRLETLQRIADAHGREILAATAGTGVSPALVLAVIAVESAGGVAAVSHAGATGLMQLMPATAERFGVADRTDPRQNIRGGVAYLDWLLAHFGRDIVLTLAGYNAGEGAVAEHGGVPPYTETRDYVPKVLAAWSLARGLCLRPPQLVSDGCVFRTGARLARSD